MALSIKSPKADDLARQLAKETGETITEATVKALEERLLRVRGRRADQGLAERIMEIGRHCASLPVLDDRTPDEILDYDEIGVPR
jgi:antitoxin VapB